MGSGAQPQLLATVSFFGTPPGIVAHTRHATGCFVWVAMSTLGARPSGECLRLHDHSSNAYLHEAHSEMGVPDALVEHRACWTCPVSAVLRARLQVTPSSFAYSFGFEVGLRAKAAVAGS